MNYNQQQEQDIKLVKTLEAFRKYKKQITSIKELSEKLGKGFSTSTIQRYFHELEEIIGKEAYEDIMYKNAMRIFKIEMNE